MVSETELEQEPPWLEQCKNCVFFLQYKPPEKNGDHYIWGRCRNSKGPKWDGDHYCGNFASKWTEGIELPNLEEEIGGVNVSLRSEK